MTVVSAWTMVRHPRRDRPIGCAEPSFCTECSTLGLLKLPWIAVLFVTAPAFSSVSSSLGRNPVRPSVTSVVDRVHTARFRLLRRQLRLDLLSALRPTTITAPYSASRGRPPYRIRNAVPARCAD